MRIHAAAKVSAFYDDDPQFEPTKLGQKGPLGFAGGLGLGTFNKTKKSTVQIPKLPWCKSPKNSQKSPKLRVTFHAPKPVVHRGVGSPEVCQGTVPGSQPGTPSYSRVFLDTEEMKQRVKDRSNRLGDVVLMRLTSA